MTTTTNAPAATILPEPANGNSLYVLTVSWEYDWQKVVIEAPKGTSDVYVLLQYLNEATHRDEGHAIMDIVEL